jgi:hypothetical protein
LWDAEVTDDQVMAVIDTIEADTIVLALDSCQSGGFARDFVTRPGVNPGISTIVRGVSAACRRKSDVRGDREKTPEIW